MKAKRAAEAALVAVWNPASHEATRDASQQIRVAKSLVGAKRQ
jgi:hypothetical protein